jgi:predicted  nucleic acid-binding Zn-ribbon protein
MSITAAALRELHRIHEQLADLRGRVERGPKQIRMHDANVANLKTRLEEARDRVKQTQMGIDRKQLDLKSGEQKVVDLRVKLNAASSNKEYQSFTEQIAAAEMAGSVLADEILELMEKIDTLSAAVMEAERVVKTGQQELEKTRVAVEGSATSLRADIARLEKQLVEAEDALPTDVRSDYQRIVRGRGADCLAVVEDGVCGGCGQQITLNMQNELMLSRPVFCKSCGCLLYLSS